MLSQMIRDAAARLFKCTLRLAPQAVRVVPAIGLVLIVVSTSQAQNSMADGPPGGSGYYSVERPYNVEHGHWQNHSSTPAEGYLRGVSSYIQALGVADVHHAQANILNEQAKWAAYENAKKRVETFYDRRRERTEWLAEERERAKIRDIEGKELLKQRRATEYRAAYRLSPSELNPSTGEITWPEVLEMDMFAAQREKLNELFAHRSTYNLEGDHFIVREIESVQSELKLSLRANRESMPHQDYVKAQSFIRGLLYEAKYS